MIIIEAVQAESVESRNQLATMKLGSLIITAFLLGVLGSLDSLRQTRACSAPYLLEKDGNKRKIIKVTSGENVKLSCPIRTSGQSTKIQYFWHKNYKRFAFFQREVEGNRKIPLEIKGVKREDKGWYTCVAVNNCGHKSYKMLLLVKAAPQFRVSQDGTGQKAIAVIIGNSVTLDCSADGYPRPTTTSYKDGILFKERKSGKKIRWRIRLTLGPSDTGSYSCNVSNRYGWIYRTFKVDAYEKIRRVPQISIIWEQRGTIYAGTDLQLYCTVLSLKDIETKFRWYFSNSFFQDEDNQGTLINRTLFKSHLETSPNSDSSRLKWKLVLNLKNLSVADTGSYSCQAENFAGTDQRETYLNVTTRLITPSKAPSSCDLSGTVCGFTQDSTHDKIEESYSTRDPRGTLSTEKEYLFDPTGNGKKTYDALVPGIVSASVLITVAVLIVIYWRRHSRIKRSLKLSILLSKHKFEYDAFVIFSSQDSEWVIKTLIPTLEEKHHFKCCVHYRDFVVGVPFRENMVNSVYKSRKTIAVMSKNFFNSNYCGSEMEYALHRLMERKDDSVVVIIIDDVDRGKLPKELRKRSYIDYQKNVEKDHWERKLVNCLKIPNNQPEEQIL
ncbi:fibroblast growth factor receptor-like 1 [Stylophora pistillata]|uniref:fibroblast growth factor receptor-like 1 n=1 Tax=Stylophora pistillata TaxID=50429 RepID=UPI000C050144|nr:fibroblast growth factor receptor-like 1 [Stylophora pistillata]